MRNDILYGDTNGDGYLLTNERAAAGGLRTLYLCILVPHIILAAGVLPLILLSFHRGLQMQVQKHKKLVSWTFPIWLLTLPHRVLLFI
jgi:putative membrane protein